MRKLLLLALPLALLFVFLSIFIFWRSGQGWQLQFEQRGQDVLLKITQARYVPAGVNLVIPSGVFFTDPQFVEIRSRGDTVPVGEISFVDTTILPGRVTLVLEGNEIDIMSRALIVNGAEYEWDSVPQPLLLNQSKTSSAP